MLACAMRRKELLICAGPPEQEFKQMKTLVDGSF
jgi:hypothetical protein